MQKTKKEIAVRLYDNPQYGKTYAKGLRHKAVFNGSADLHDPKLKYLLDYYPFAAWEHTARTDAEMETLGIVSETAKPDTLVSWVLRYDPKTKAKTSVIGYSTLDLETNLLELAIVDEESHLQYRWQIVAKACKQVTGKTVPVLLATNTDLGSW